MIFIFLQQKKNRIRFLSEYKRKFVFNSSEYLLLSIKALELLEPLYTYLLNWP